MTIIRAAAGLDEVADLWKSLARHHYSVGAELGELAAPVGLEASWRDRRRQYETWSAEPGWLMVVASVDDAVRGDAAVRGYAACRITASASAWDFGDRVGRLETLAVLPGSRGHGLGTALVNSVCSHWRQSGVRFATVSVVAGNDAAVRFYERLGAVEFTRTSVFPV
jgi:ribosomal protein S18 acetylase RimI-like enzyme